MNLERAIAIAVEAHAGQVDKGGQTYVLHPLRVMLAMETEEERIVGILHDVIEDCPAWTLDRLYYEEGLPQPLLAPLRCLTRKPGEPYDDFILRCKRNEIARKVKLADLADNLDPSRKENISPQQQHRYLCAQIELVLDR